MLISIVVPIYKVEKYLRQCVDSILAQTYKDLEVILVDDGSPDGCPAIVDEYKEKDSRIVAIHQANGGYGKAVNAGIARARGEYVGIVESDDFIEPTMFEELVKAVRKTGTDAVRCSFYIHDGRSDYLWPEVVEFNHLDGQVIRPRDYFPIFYFHSAPWCYLYRRSLFPGISLSESKGASYQDVTLVAEVLLSVDAVTIVGKPLLHYRMEAGQASSCTSNGRGLMAIVDRYAELQAFMETHGFTAPEYATLLLRKSIQGINWFYHRVAEAIRPEFYQRLEGFFSGLLKKYGNDIEWATLTLQERLWLWTLLSGNYALSYPVLLQDSGNRDLERKIVDAIVASLPSFAGTPLAMLFPPVECHAGAVPVLMAADRNYIKYASVTLASILGHVSASRTYHFVLLVDFDFVTDDIVKMRALLAGHPNVFFSAVDVRRHFFYAYIRNLFVDRHLSLATYYRFVAPYVCFGYEKCVYLDCDVAVCEDIATLHDTVMGQAVVAGSRDYVVSNRMGEMARKTIAYLHTLGYKREANYICAGVLLFNLRRMAEQCTSIRLLRASAAHRFIFHDQDALNFVCGDDLLLLDDRWNFIMHENPGCYPVMAQQTCKTLCLAQHGCFHFAGGDRKPWVTPHLGYAWIWWQAARRSPYYEELLQQLAYWCADASGRRFFAHRASTTDNTNAVPNCRRPLKYLLPYGLMRKYLSNRYGMVIDESLMAYPGFFKRAKRMVKFSLPYGLIEAWKHAADDPGERGCLVAVVRKLLRPRRG